VGGKKRTLRGLPGSRLIHLLLRDGKGGVREEEFRMKRQP
jgi:hypothetical protein